MCQTRRANKISAKPFNGLLSDDVATLRETKRNREFDALSGFIFHCLRLLAMERPRASTSLLGASIILPREQIYLFGARPECKNTVANALRILRSSYCGWEAKRSVRPGTSKSTTPRRAAPRRRDAAAASPAGNTDVSTFGPEIGSFAARRSTTTMSQAFNSRYIITSGSLGHDRVAFLLEKLHSPRRWMRTCERYSWRKSFELHTFFEITFPFAIRVSTHCGKEKTRHESTYYITLCGHVAAKRWLGLFGFSLQIRSPKSNYLL